MRRILKAVALVVVIAIVLAFLVKDEHYLQVHYDTLEERNLERVSFFEFVIRESPLWKREGFRAQYKEIFDSDPPDNRWRSPAPIRTTWLGTERWRSPFTPHAIRLRNSITRSVFAKYERDRSIPHAREAFRELEAVLPVSDRLEHLNYEELNSIRASISANPMLQSLIAIAPGEATRSEQAVPPNGP